jgi:hypothetical protein
MNHLVIAAAAAASLHCTVPQNRQFDFWLGSWTVRNYARALEGTDTVTREYGACVIQEVFRASDGSSYGSSFSFYDPSDARWHYTWVDNLGAFERFSGGRVGSSMVMSGTVRTRKGAMAQERMTWTPIGGGRLRQLWQVSVDGAHWKTISDVYYWPAT